MPEAACLTESLREEIKNGRISLSLEPVPNWPASPEPHINNLPLSSTMAVCLVPQETESTSTFPLEDLTPICEMIFTFFRERDTYREPL